MPAASMNTRLVALEEKCGVANGPTVAVLMTDRTLDDEAAQQIADAKAAWARNHGRGFPAGGRVLRIVLVGMKPEDRRGADAH